MLESVVWPPNAQERGLATECSGAWSPLLLRSSGVSRSRSYGGIAGSCLKPRGLGDSRMFIGYRGIVLWVRFVAESGVCAGRCVSSESGEMRVKPTALCAGSGGSAKCSGTAKLCVERLRRLCALTPDVCTQNPEARCRCRCRRLRAAR
eukprot:15449617-Alexandrium_andersonii.AAC.1